MRIVILGAGGTLPTLKRNLPSVALRREGEVILFDCGEGTQLQLMKARVGFGSISVICISHLHGDHVTGIPGLLMTLGQSGREKELIFYGPPGLEKYVYGVMDHISIRPGYPVIVRDGGEGVPYEGDGFRIEAAPADHTLPTLAYALIENHRPGRFNADRARELGIPEGPLYRDLQNGTDILLGDGRRIRAGEIVGPPRPGRKIVYAIDTRPCRSVLQLAGNADVLIHDGMFADEMEIEAGKRGHSTARQAAKIAEEAKVKRLILTHISPRYEDDAPLLEEARSVFPETAMARDLMTIDIPVHK